MATPSTRAGWGAVLADLLAAVTSLDAGDIADGAEGWRAARASQTGQDLASEALEVTITVTGGVITPPGGHDLAAHTVALSWPIRYVIDGGPSDDTSSQAALLASVVQASQAVRAWGHAATGSRAIPTGYTVSDAGSGWLRVTLSCSLLAPWRL